VTTKTTSYADAHVYHDAVGIEIVCSRRVLASDDPKLDKQVISDMRCPSCASERAERERTRQRRR
jgi:hypothetical protein